MYAVYRELHPPTGVEHCLECRFFDQRRKSLVVASTSLLRVFDVAQAKGHARDKKGGSRLVQVGEYRLQGNIESMDSVQLAQSQRDSLLLSFRDAKLSVVEYDPDINDLKTVSMHYFEEEELRDSLLHNIHRPVVHSDPEDRCAAMLVHGNSLAVVPFHRDDTVIDEHEPMLPSLPREQRDILPSYTIDLQVLTERVTNVKDFQFLHGYNNPTVLFLYEPTPTWAGRISLRKDTCCIVAISLNMSEHVQPVIWQLRNLPFDCRHTLPVPRPIGGMLIMGANVLLYLNQSAPAVGMSLNSMNEKSTNFPLKAPAGNLSISMDCAVAAFISCEQLAVSLKGGEIYVLTLIPDGMRGVKNIVFEKAAAGVLASCICAVGREHVVLGSRLGNTLLLKYSKKTAESLQEPPVKRRKSDDFLLSEDMDELEVYGSDIPSGPVMSSYTFEVCDSLLNIGPISDITMGQPALLSEEFSEKADPDLELVTCSGHGKNGALCVLQRGVRPQVVTTFELPGCVDMWTVLSNPDLQSGSLAEEHAFLILGRQDSTMVLQTGQEITELDSSGFATQVPTVFAGNVGSGKYIVQVTGADARLLKGVKQLCRVPLDMGGGVKSCDLADPYTVILLADGTVALLELCEERGGEMAEGGEEVEGRLKLTWPDLKKGSKVALVSAYTDRSGLFSSKAEAESADVVGPTHSATPPTEKGAGPMSVDDEEQLLYGMSQETERERSSLNGYTFPEAVSLSTSHWCALYRDDGSLELYQVPEFSMAYCVRNFSASPRTLMDSGPVSLPSPHPGTPQLHSSEQHVEEVVVVGLGPGGSHPHILTLVDRELVIYQAFRHRQSHDGHLRLRFSKVQHSILLHDHKEAKLSRRSSSGVNGEGEGEGEGRTTPSLRVYTDIAGYSGVFVCGLYPHWLFMTQRGALFIHPLTVDGPIASFAAFHNVNCPKGFLYFNYEGELRICVLPSHLSYDSYWPVRKVPTRCSTYFIGYHTESKVHAVVTSDSTPVRDIPVATSDNPEHLEPINRDEQFILPMEDRFHLQLYSPTSWEPVPTSKLSMERFDRVTTMKVMSLRSQETMSGRKEFIVVGATSVCGEDFVCKGRILIFDVIEVIPEPGKPLTKHKLKCLYNQEQKGTVSALEAVDGLILACMGQKIFMWHFKDNKDLVGVAFIDSELYVHCAHSLKSFILTGDITRSVQLLRYQEDLKTLSLVSKDLFPIDVFSCEYIVDGPQLGFVVSDSDRNLIIFQYQSELPESDGGQHLIRRGDFNVGAHVNAFFRVHCKSAAPPGAQREMRALMTDKRHVTYFATLDGGLGYVLPIPEKVYRRLHMLQIRLVTGLAHTAGLNPKAFRTFSSRHQYLHNPQRNVLDAQLLQRYPQLSWKERTDFAKQIGTSQTQLMDDLKEMDKVTAHF